MYLLNNVNKFGVLAVDEAAMRFTNKKSKRNGIIHHEINNSNGDGLYLVRALAEHVTRIFDNGGTDSMLLCSYWNSHQWNHVTTQNIGKK